MCSYAHIIERLVFCLLVVGVFTTHGYGWGRTHIIRPGLTSRKTRPVPLMQSCGQRRDRD